ncbi:MAG: hypothetical protein R6U61_07410 [Thermoplasmata archaeon]
MKMNDRGVTDLPLKLLIMIVLIGTAIPLGAVSYREASRTRFENHTREKLKELMTVASSLQNEGNLSRDVFDLNLDGNTFATLDYLMIGDELGSRDWVIEYKMDWKNDPKLVTSPENDVHITSIENKSYEMNSNYGEIALTHIYFKDDSFIIVSRPDTVIHLKNFV